MLGAIDGSILLDIMKKEGYMYQLPLFKTIPEYTIEEKYLCDVFDGYTCTLTEHGSSAGTTSFCTHPAFARLRNVLEDKGLIKVQRSWHNGDRVLEPFKLNDFQFEAGDRFLSAGAIKHTLTKGK